MPNDVLLKQSFLESRSFVLLFEVCELCVQDWIRISCVGKVGTPLGFFRNCCILEVLACVVEDDEERSDVSEIPN